MTKRQGRYYPSCRFHPDKGAKTKPGQAHDALSNDMRGLKHAMGPSRRGHGFALIPKT